MTTPAAGRAARAWALLAGAWLALLPGCRLEADDWPAVKAAIRARYPRVRTLRTEELAAWLARQDTLRPVLLDARAPVEFAVSHLAGARLAPDADTAVRLLAAAPLDTPIVAYCSVGYRSAGVANRLRHLGYTSVYNLEGSLFQWANEGRPLWRGDRRVEVVHPYGRRWSGLLDPKRRAAPDTIAALAP